MKKTLFTLLLFLFSFAVICGQSIKIVPKKIVYRIPNSQKEDDNLEIIYPRIKSKVSNNVKKNFNNSISYWRIFQTTLKDELEDGGTYLYEYKIYLNQNNILGIQLIQESMGAYPWTNRADLLIDLRTGKEVKFGDVFKRTKLRQLFNKIKPQFEKEKQRAIDQGNEYDVEDDEYRLKDLEDFTISKKGVTFHYNFGFAFGRLALQPEGKYFFSWKEIKPFIKRNGLLGKFIR